jgi:hypothetical protein
MVGRTAGRAILDGFDQEHERVGGNWQCAHAADPALLNTIDFSPVPECVPLNVC